MNLRFHAPQLYYVPGLAHWLASTFALAIVRRRPAFESSRSWSRRARSRPLTDTGLCSSAPPAHQPRNAAPHALRRLRLHSLAGVTIARS